MDGLRCGEGAINAAKEQPPHLGCRKAAVDTDRRKDRKVTRVSETGRRWHQNRALPGSRTSRHSSRRVSSAQRPSRSACSAPRLLSDRSSDAESSLLAGGAGTRNHGVASVVVDGEVAIGFKARQAHQRFGCEASISGATCQGGRFVSVVDANAYVSRHWRGARYGRRQVQVARDAGSRAPNRH